jgi:pimeloyl-ACP methyl ester carboxylesterase
VKNPATPCAFLLLLSLVAPGCGDDDAAGSDAGASHHGEEAGGGGAGAGSTSSGASSAGGTGGAGGSPVDDFDVPAPAVTWASCELEDGTDIECADVPVPLDWSDLDGPTMTVRAYRRLAATETPRGSLTFLEGGPDNSGGIGRFASQYDETRHPDLDLLGIDHRGTGASGPLQCAAPSDPPDDDCLTELQAAHPERIAATTTSAAALDVVAIAHWFGRGSSRLLFGWSYGTYWAHRAVSLAPHAWDGLVLDSPCDVIEGCPAARRDLTQDAVNRAILAHCDEDASCSARLSAPTLEVAERVIAAADAGACSLAEDVGLDGVGMRRALSQLASDATFLVPALLFRYERCSAEDGEVFANVAATLDWADTLLPSLPDFSLPTNYHVSRAEFWDAATTVADTEAAFRTTVASNGASMRWAERFATWPWPVPDVDDGLHAWSVRTVPTLVLLGAIDASTPAALVAPLRDELGPGSTFVELPFARHVESARDTPAGRCASSLVEAFLDAPGASLDDGCAAAAESEQRASIFAPVDSTTQFWFGTTSIYGD